MMPCQEKKDYHYINITITRSSPIKGEILLRSRESLLFIFWLFAVVFSSLALATLGLTCAQAPAYQNITVKCKLRDVR